MKPEPIEFLMFYAGARTWAAQCREDPSLNVVAAYEPGERMGPYVAMEQAGIKAREKYPNREPVFLPGGRS